MSADAIAVAAVGEGFGVMAPARHGVLAFGSHPRVAYRSTHFSAFAYFDSVPSPSYLLGFFPPEPSGNDVGSSHVGYRSYFARYHARPLSSM